MSNEPLTPSVGINVLHLFCKITSTTDAEAVTAVHGTGLTVGVWTVNAPGELERALAAGVDYVTTDRPDLALRIRGR